MYIDLGININGKKKQLVCVLDFLGLEFYILLIKAQFPKNKLKKTIEKVAKILKKKSSITYKEL